MRSETPSIPLRVGQLSREAKQRLLSSPGDPLFLADWADTLMVHLEADPSAVQRATPFQIDLFEGRAFVSLVFFTLRRMRPAFGGRITEWLFRPISTHPFLNIRTYVRCNNEPGIQFLTEWMPNRFSRYLGPLLFGLPYRLGRLSYEHRVDRSLTGEVVDADTGESLQYVGTLLGNRDYAACESGTLDEWLMERYTAFTYRRQVCRYFRVWHHPWLQGPVAIQSLTGSLLRSNWPWLREATLVGANYSPGIRDVWMGRPYPLHTLRTNRGSSPRKTP